MLTQHYYITLQRCDQLFWHNSTTCLWRSTIITTSMLRNQLSSAFMLSSAVQLSSAYCMHSVHQS